MTVLWDRLRTRMELQHTDISRERRLQELDNALDGELFPELHQSVSDFLRLFRLKRQRLCEIIRELLQVPADLKRIVDRRRRGERAAIATATTGLVAGLVAIPFTRGYSSVLSGVAVVTGIATIVGVHVAHNKATRKRHLKLRTLGEEFVTAAAGLKQRLQGLDAALTEGLNEPREDINVPDLQREVKKSLLHFDRLTADVTVVSILIDTDHFNKAIKAMDELEPILKVLEK